MKKLALLTFLIFIPEICFSGTANTVRTDAQTTDQVPVYRPSLGGSLGSSNPNAYFRLSLGDIIEDLVNESETITGTWAFPDSAYNVSTWDGVNTAVTKNSFRDYIFNFDSDGDGLFTGEATADTGQTISGVTCSGQTVTPDDGAWDEQIEAFTCLANLAFGENTLVFVGSDGTRTGSDSVTITRTIPGEYTTRGAGFSIKGCTLK